MDITEKKKSPVGIGGSVSPVFGFVSVAEDSSLPQQYDNIPESGCQVEMDKVCLLNTTECVEVVQKFTPKKKFSALLAESYGRLQMETKQQRVSECGSFLEFAHDYVDGKINPQGKLHNANFCRDRLCPMCAWRRSYKIFGQISKIMDYIAQDYAFLFVTLTVPSVKGDKLSETIDRMNDAFIRKFMKYSAIKKAVCGFYRALEITRQNDKKSKSYGLYHPHFHCVFAVNKSYFKKSGYLKRDEWLHFWQKAYGDESITQVDVRRAYDKRKSDLVQSDALTSADAVASLSSAVAEIAKYAVKVDEDMLLDDEVVKTLSDALYHRRLVSFGGCFKEAYENLGLDDAEDGDLIHVDDNINASLVQLIVRYGWNCGAYSVIETYLKHSLSSIDISCSEDSEPLKGSYSALNERLKAV